MPLYEYEEGTSRKFYRIDLDGRRVLLHWGRISTQGEHKILTFETEREAREEYERQCDKRTHDRNYSLVRDEEIPPAAIRARDVMVAKLFGTSEQPEKRTRVRTKLADASALEKVVAEDPYDEDRWSVLEDFLLEQDGDPRSELVRFAKNKQRGEEAQQRGAWLSLLLGRKHAPISRALGMPVWRGGYLVKCDIALARDPIVMMNVFLASPAARLLRELSVQLHAAHVPAIGAQIAQAPGALALRKLELMPSGGDRTELDGEVFSELALVELIAGLPIMTTNAAAVSTLELLSVHADTLAYVERLFAGTLSRLHTLVVAMHAIDAEPTAGRRLAAALARLANGTFAPKIASVTLRFSNEVLAAVARDTLRTLTCKLHISD